MNQFGVYLPNVGWETVPKPAELVEYAVAAEQLGLDSVWVEDRLLHSRVGILEALTTLTFVASRTQRIQLGTSILLVNLRNPLILAKAISTLDYLAGHRVIVGASLGGRPEEYQAAGVPMKSRVSRFVETINTMRAFWGQGSLDHVSKFFQTTDLSMQPRSTERPIPIWIGGRAEPVLHRVATLGDGWLASSTTTAQEFRDGWAKIQEHAISSGREPGSITPAKFVYIHIEESSEKALAVLRSMLPNYYDFPYDTERNTIYGPPAQCVEQALELLKSGVQTLIFATVAQDRTQLELLAQHVVRELRSSSGH